MSPRTGRRAGESGTREAVLEAARERFADLGYDGATIRAIAADAGVDSALVHHFYGTKEQLFAEAVGFPAVPSEVLAKVMEGGLTKLGDSVIRSILTLWETDDGAERIAALLRSAVANESAMRMLREFLTSAILRVVAIRLEVADAEFRASLVASQLLGLAMARYVFQLRPLASASLEEIANAIAPTLQRYLTGRISSA
ncbi:MAG TPA: TetR family transcriptional regulator [Acidimicrobiales bacterium]|nr:TetR family transcriptional regulator [Acidimicrobiales bacterium]